VDILLETVLSAPPCGSHFLTGVRTGSNEKPASQFPRLIVSECAAYGPDRFIGFDRDVGDRNFAPSPAAFHGDNSEERLSLLSHLRKDRRLAFRAMGAVDGLHGLEDILRNVPHPLRVSGRVIADLFNNAAFGIFIKGLRKCA
jgi:hypothetical protein